MRPDIIRPLWRGLRKKCPHCGSGPLFKSWFVLNQSCEICGCIFQDREDDTYFFMYISTGFLTGAFLISLFFLIPTNFFQGKIILLFASLALFVTSHPYRKGLAVAIDYLVDSHSEYPKHERRKFD